MQRPAGRCALRAVGAIADLPGAVRRTLASALGPQVRVGEPRDGFVGRMNVSPENGPAGTPLTVTAERLPPKQEFQLVWRTDKGTGRSRTPNIMAANSPRSPMRSPRSRPNSPVG